MKPANIITATIAGMLGIKAALDSATITALLCMQAVILVCILDVLQRKLK